MGMNFYQAAILGTMLSLHTTTSLLAISEILTFVKNNWKPLSGILHGVCTKRYVHCAVLQVYIQKPLHQNSLPT